VKYFEALDSYYRLNITNGNLHRENEGLRKINGKLARENENLRIENKDYRLLCKAFGSKQMDNLLEQAKVERQAKQRGKRFRNNKEER
jgi:regulator of replication initiation timing